MSPVASHRSRPLTIGRPGYPGPQVSELHLSLEAQRPQTASDLPSSGVSSPVATSSSRGFPPPDVYSHNHSRSSYEHEDWRTRVTSPQASMAVPAASMPPPGSAHSGSRLVCTIISTWGDPNYVREPTRKNAISCLSDSSPPP